MKTLVLADNQQLPTSYPSEGVHKFQPRVGIVDSFGVARDV